MENNLEEQVLFNAMQQVGLEITKAAYNHYIKYVTRNEAETVYNGFIDYTDCSLVRYVELLTTLEDNHVIVLVTRKDGTKQNCNITLF